LVFEPELGTMSVRGNTQWGKKWVVVGVRCNRTTRTNLRANVVERMIYEMAQTEYS